MAKRRGPGEGSIMPYKRNGIEVPNKWIVFSPSTWDVGPRKRVKRIVTGPHKAAVDALDQLKESQRSLGAIPPADQTTGEYLTWWLEHMVKSGNRRISSTWFTYDRIVRVCLIPNIGRVRLDKLSHAHINRLFTVLAKDKGYSLSTCRSMRAVLISALSDAFRLKKIRYNWARETESIKLDYRPRVRLKDLSEVERFLDAAWQDHNGHLYALTLTLGLRVGEALGLQWSDFDEQARTLTINHTLKRGYDGQAILGPPKTPASWARIELDPVAYNILIDWRRKVQRERLRVGEGWISSPRWRGYDFIFTYIGPSNTRRYRGDPLVSTAISNAFSKFLRKHGLPHMRFHDLRGSTATLLVHTGVDIQDARKILRHTDIRQTMNVYAEIPDADVRQSRILYGAFLQRAGISGPMEVLALPAPQDKAAG